MSVIEHVEISLTLNMTKTWKKVSRDNINLQSRVISDSMLQKKKKIFLKYLLFHLFFFFKAEWQKEGETENFFQWFQKGAQQPGLQSQKLPGWPGLSAAALSDLLAGS